MTTAPPRPAPAQPTEPQADESRAALIRLVLIAAAGIVAGIAAGIGNVLLVIFALVAMIMLHELGHFATAKWAGMKVTQYFLGFGPRLWSIRRGETEYGIKAIPAGGYVKIIGMSNLDEVDPADEPRTYRQAPYRWRLAVGLAGSTMHFLLALVLLFALYSAVGLPNENRPTTRVDQVLALASGESPAQRAGFRVGDTIVAVDSQPARSWDDMTAYIRARPGQTVKVTVRRDGRLVTLTPTLVDLSTVDVKNFPNSARPAHPTGFIGISPAPTIERTGAVTALGRAFVGLARTIRASISGIVHLFSPSGLSHYASTLAGGQSGSAQADANRPVGIVGAVSVASQFTGTQGLRGFLLIFIQIVVFIGVFNLLPVLPFDGGHVAIATYERIRSRGRRYYADAAKMMPVMYAVLLLVLLIFVTTNYLDITHPVHVTP